MSKFKNFSKLYQCWSYEWFSISPGYDLLMILKYFFSLKLPTSYRNFCMILPSRKKLSNAKISQLHAEISDYVEISEMKVCSESFPKRLSWPTYGDFWWFWTVAQIGKFWKKKFLKKKVFFSNFLKNWYFWNEVGQLQKKIKNGWINIKTLAE